jgi:REP element-mobilizing transposase RayT
MVAVGGTHGQHMSTYTQIIYHIVFATKNRMRILTDDHAHDLYRYMNGILIKKQCRPHQINGTMDHIHILSSLHPTISISDLVKDIKVASSMWVKEQKLFNDFCGWQDGYGAFTHSRHERNRLIAYVANQQQHHREKDFLDEYKALLIESGVVFDDRYLP